MLKDTWRSVLTWSFISTVIFFILILLFSPYMDRSAKGIIMLIGALFFASFFILTILLMIITQIKAFKVADDENRILMIIVFLMALAYVLPKAIANFKK